MTLPRPLVLYHANCPDGFGAAWAAWLALGDAAEYRPVNHGDPAPDVSGRAVFILDFSWPRETIARLHGEAAELEILDHHKTAQADLDGLAFATFDLTRSGATMAWDYFHGATLPRGLPRTFVAYLEDRDLWRWALPESREVSAAVYSWPWDFETWTRLAMDVDGLRCDGRAILRAKEKVVQEQAERAVWREIAGYRVPVVNTTVYFSEVGEALCQRYPEAPFAAYYFDRADETRQWGARGREGGVDCSAIAKTLGGGGQPAAAGWVEKWSWS